MRLEPHGVAAVPDDVADSAFLAVDDAWKPVAVDPQRPDARPLLKLVLALRGSGQQVVDLAPVAAGSGADLMQAALMIGDLAGGPERHGWAAAVAKGHLRPDR